MPRDYFTPGLTALDRRLRRAAAAAVDHADGDLAAATARAAPVRTGRMAGSVEVLPARVADRGVAGAVRIGDPDAVHEEYGTANQDPNPFFRRSIAARRGPMRRGIISSLKNI